MSIDVLQNLIRKRKNPLMLRLALTPEQIPPVYAQGKSAVQAAESYAVALMEGLQEQIVGVRVSFSSFALLGAEGLEALKRVLARAKELGLYVILDHQCLEEPGAAEYAAALLLREKTFCCDGLTLNVWAGSETVKPYIAASESHSIYVTLKTGNRSGAELQDLITGGRLVYTAAADMVNLWGEGKWGRSGYSRVAGIAGAANAQALKSLRQKYSRMFLMVEGLEVSGANAKNCALAFDRMGHGAVCCAGSSLTCAWKESGEEPIAAAKSAADRWKRNLGRYVTIL